MMIIVVMMMSLVWGEFVEEVLDLVGELRVDVSGTGFERSEGRIII